MDESNIPFAVVEIANKVSKILGAVYEESFGEPLEIKLTSFPDFWLGFRFDSFEIDSSRPLMFAHERNFFDKIVKRHSTGIDYLHKNHSGKSEFLTAGRCSASFNRSGVKWELSYRSKSVEVASVERENAFEEECQVDVNLMFNRSHGVSVSVTGSHVLTALLRQRLDMALDGSGEVSDSGDHYFAVTPETEKLVVGPESFCHDGDFKAESEGATRWLWSGPRSDWRLVLGQLPSYPVLLSIVVVSEGEKGNIDNLRTFINGCVHPFIFESWGGGSGRLSWNIDNLEESPVIISLGVPLTFKPPGSERNLGMCFGILTVEKGSKP